MMTEKSQPLNERDLKDSLLLRGIDLEPVLGLLKDCPVRELKEGTILIHAGKPNRALYLVLSGRLRIHIENLDLDPIAILEPGEIVGELSLIDDQVASASVVAHEDCRLLELDEKTMWTLVEDSHAVARNLLFILSRRLRHGNAVIGASLLEKVSGLELEEFQPQGIPESEGGLKQDGEDEPVSLYNTAIAYVLESIGKAQKKKSPDRKQGEKLVREMIDSISESSDLLLLATDRTREFAVSTHSVNVAILALRLAQTLAYDPQNQIKVGFAALLHELGVALLPERLLYQPGQVSPQVRQRPVYSAKLLKKFYPEEDWLSETVGQVYERANGSGFPLGLEGEQVREEAQILGIVDVFEACIHDRPYRKALTGYQLLEELTRGSTKTFSDHIVKALVRSFSLYPYNEYVILNTDELGQVMEINPQKLSRPVIKILFDKQGKLLSEPRETDLAQHPSLFISKAVTYHDLP
jgi:HD-GYP domain-containing protein (c-di-GMP phosphodiesterase class II)